MTPCRILFVIRTYPPDQVGGAARSTQNLAEALQARGHDVHIARLAPRGYERATLEAADRAGLLAPGKPRIHVLPMRNIYWPYDLAARTPARKAVWHILDLHNLLARHDFSRLLKCVRPHVVNTSVIDGFSTAIFAAVKQAGAVLLHTMRDYYLVCTRSGMFKDGRNCTALCGSCRLSAFARRRDAREVDLFLANSAYVADMHVRHGAIGADQPCRVQLNINEQRPVHEPRAVGAGAIVFGFIGRIVPTKGVERLLEAATRLPRDGRPWRLEIAGAGDDRFAQELIGRFTGHPNLRFLGWVRPDDFYRSVDVLVCPSTYNEPLPRVIYEGYGHALPVIAAATGGIPEIVDDGATGLLYPGNDTDTLAQAMERFRAMESAEYRRFSAAALARSHMFASDAVVASYEARIEAVLAGKIADAP